MILETKSDNCYLLALRSVGFISGSRHFFTARLQSHPVINETFGFYLTGQPPSLLPYWNSRICSCRCLPARSIFFRHKATFPGEIVIRLPMENSLSAGNIHLWSWSAGNCNTAESTCPTDTFFFRLILVLFLKSDRARKTSKSPEHLAGRGNSGRKWSIRHASIYICIRSRMNPPAYKRGNGSGQKETICVELLSFWFVFQVKFKLLTELWEIREV